MAGQQRLKNINACKLNFFPTIVLLDYESIHVSFEALIFIVKNMVLYTIAESVYCLYSVWQVDVPPGTGILLDTVSVGWSCLDKSFAIKVGTL